MSFGVENMDWKCSVYEVRQRQRQHQEVDDFPFLVQTQYLVWHYAGYGCFKIPWYDYAVVNTLDDCKEFCQKQTRCSVLLFYGRGKCFIGNNGYKPMAGCVSKRYVVEKDVNECAVTQNACGANADCKNTPGSFECVCRFGYYKKDGKICAKIPHAQWIKPRHGCFDFQPLFTTKERTPEYCKSECQKDEKCLMAQYTTATKICKLARHRQYDRVKPCKENRDVVFVKAEIECNGHGKKCKHFAFCHSEGGNHLCRCRIGYKGDGKKCDDINECATYNDLCGEYASCVNTVGSYKCVCNKGYSGDGKTCIKEKVKQGIDDAPENEKSNTFHTIINLFHNSATSIKCPQNLGHWKPGSLAMGALRTAFIRGHGQLLFKFQL